MDPIAGTVLLGAMIASIPGVIGITAFQEWRSRRNLARARREWADFARARGMLGAAWQEHGEWKLRHAGRIRDRRVTIAMPAPGPMWATVAVEIDPPLDLGATVNAVGDGAPVLDAWDRKRAELVLGPAFARAASFHEDTTWIADDFAVRFLVRMTRPDAAALDAVIEAGIDFVTAVDRGRRLASTAEPPETEAEAWRRVARKAGFAYGEVPLMMSGEIDGVAVAAYATLRDGAYGTGATVRFATPLGGAIGLAPTSPGALAPWVELDPSHAAAEDCRIGDPELDAAFVVRTREPARLSTILPAPLRKRLLHLHQRTPLYLDDFALRAMTRFLLPPARIPSLLRQLCEVAAEIEANVRGRGAGPYR